MIATKNEQRRRKQVPTVLLCKQFSLTSENPMQGRRLCCQPVFPGVQLNVTSEDLKSLCKVKKRLHAFKGWRGEFSPGAVGLLCSGCGAVALDCGGWQGGGFEWVGGVLSAQWSLTSGALSSATLLNHPQGLTEVHTSELLETCSGFSPLCLTSTAQQRMGSSLGNGGYLGEGASLCVCTTWFTNWKSVGFQKSACETLAGDHTCHFHHDNATCTSEGRLQLQHSLKWFLNTASV